MVLSHFLENSHEVKTVFFVFPTVGVFDHCCYLGISDRLISWITLLFICFPCSTVLFLFQFFRFQVSKSFSSSVIFSSLLLSTPIYPIIDLVLGESASLSSFALVSF